MKAITTKAINNFLTKDQSFATTIAIEVGELDPTVTPYFEHYNMAQDILSDMDDYNDYLGEALTTFEDYEALYFEAL